MIYELFSSYCCTRICVAGMRPVWSLAGRLFTPAAVCRLHSPVWPGCSQASAAVHLARLHLHYSKVPRICALGCLAYGGCHFGPFTCHRAPGRQCTTPDMRCIYPDHTLVSCGAGFSRLLKILQPVAAALTCTVHDHGHCSCHGLVPAWRCTFYGCQTTFHRRVFALKSPQKVESCTCMELCIVRC